jgi:hypothetical protein
MGGSVLIPLIESGTMRGFEHHEILIVSTIYEMYWYLHVCIFIHATCNIFGRFSAEIRYLDFKGNHTYLKNFLYDCCKQQKINIFNGIWNVIASLT